MPRPTGSPEPFLPSPDELEVSPGRVTESGSLPRESPAPDPAPDPLRRLLRLIMISVVAVLGVALLIVLPPFAWAKSFEVRQFLWNPFVRVIVIAGLLVLGPKGVVGLIPRRVRGRLAGWAGRELRREPIAVAVPLAIRARRAVAATLRGRTAGLDGLAARLLSGPATAVGAALCALLLLTWVPHYLTWPWWADTDQFAVSAQFWDAGVRPFGDLEDFDFPGPIYVQYLLGKAFGWGSTVAYNAADAGFVVLLGVALAVWSRRLFGSALPGLSSFLIFLCWYLGFNYSQVAQRDWRAPFFVLMALFAQEAWPGRAGRLASALAMATALAFRPHVIVFLPAMASAVDEGGRRAEEPWRRAIAPLLEWSILLAASLVLVYSPLILAGVMDDFIRSVHDASHGEYNEFTWARCSTFVQGYLLDRQATRWLAALVVMAFAGPDSLRRPARTWAMALLGVFFYKPISPFPHAYLDQPLMLIETVCLAPPVAWALMTCRLSASWRLAVVVVLLASSLPRTVAEYCSASRSLQALGPLVRGEDPVIPPPGCIREFSSAYFPNKHYRWDDYRRALAYLRRSTHPQTRVAALLWDFPYPPINGPTGRLTPFPAAGGYIHLSTIDPGLIDRYVEILEHGRDVLVVWGPDRPNRTFPELDRVTRRAYQPLARFGGIEIWRHRESRVKTSGRPRSRPIEALRRGRSGMADGGSVAYNAGGVGCSTSAAEPGWLPHSPSDPSTTDIREPATMTTAASDRSLTRLHDRLSRETRAEVYFDQGRRGLYATDASLYQIDPLGVVVPRTVEDVVNAVRIAAEEGAPVLPRGGATSLSGQTIGPAIVIDFSKYLNRVGVVDRDRMTVRVEPGVVLDRLNAHLRPLGLMFGPDVSTSDRATIGGMIGNNSAGARSLRYGKTVDHVRAVDVVLADGTAATLGPVADADLDAVCARPDRVGNVHRVVRDITNRHRDEIAARFPRILRRVSGYNLDEFIPGLPVRPVGWTDEPWQFNLARLIVGSEGTLAVATGAELKVMPVPPAQGLVVLSFETIPAALDRLAEIVATGPVAVEMLDRMILELAARNPLYSHYLDFTEGLPAAVLAAQFYADSQDELAGRAEDLARRFEGRPGVLSVRRRLTDAAKDDFWKVRKAGFSLLMAMVGDAKPIAFVEDTAVDPARLPEFYDRFRQIVERQGVTAACYGHADVGCLHIRPIINVKTAEGVGQVRAIAREVSDLVAEYGGAMSGEHGDGLARSLWNAKLFGPEVYACFEAVKHAFDPDNLMNPGKVVAAPDLADNLRIGPDYHPYEPETVLDFSNQGGFARAVEMCSGVGACRKEGGGTMCPSYMVTRDEEHTTRGRANALRLVMSGALPADGLANETLHEALDLCLQCKACKSECPSNVDMAKLKAEFLHHYYQGHPLPLGSLLMGQIHRLNPIGAATAPLANWTLRQGWFKWILEKTAGIDRRRELPHFDANHLRKWLKSHTPDPRAGTRGAVLLLDDCFTTYNTPDVGRAAVRVLEAAGYRVEPAGLPCCGRPAISKGLLTLGRDLARANVAKLIGHVRRGTPIVGCEPSCLLTLVDEYREFRIGPDADLVARSALLVDAFVADPGRVPELPLTPYEGRVLLHGHCQQKALVGTAGTVAALRRIPGLEVKELDSGCCGMAGSFGYELGHYDVSTALANRVLLPAAAAEPQARLVAPGFSCRSQVHGIAGIEALHPIELLAAQLDGSHL